ncbi:MAG: IS21 family transposase, partial [Candidatus Delongbacteria bacterium]
MKANYSSLSRKYGISRQTISKYAKGFTKKKSRKKQSKLDTYKEEISYKMSLSGVTITGVYEYMKRKYPSYNFGSRSNFDAYV